LPYGVRLIQRKGEVRVRMPAVPAEAVAAIILTFGSVPVFGALWCCFATVMPSLVVAISVGWGLVVASAVVVYVILAIPVLAGEADLVIDHRRQTLTLPQVSGRKQAIVV